MDFVATRSVAELALAASCIHAGDSHLAIRSVRRAVRLIEFGTSMAVLGREFPEDGPSDSAPHRTDDDHDDPAGPGVTKAISIRARARARTVPGPGTPTDRETALLGRLRQVAADIWEAFGSTVDPVDDLAWERLHQLTRRSDPVAPTQDQLAGTAEIYRTLVELNAAVLRWERLHQCDSSLSSDLWCAAARINPLFPMLPPAPGMTPPRAHRGATTW